MMLWFLIWFQIESPCPTIQSISIHNYDVFGQGNFGWIKRTIRALHMTTKQRIIRQELIFKVGDCYDPQRIRESERRLRELNFLADATIRVTETPEGVLVDVETLDRFTLRAELSFNRRGGLNKTRVSLGEDNLLGVGIDMHFTQSNRSDGNDIKRFTFQDPRFLKNFAVESLYSHTDEGIYHSFSFAKPFWSLADRHAFLLETYADKTKADLYGFAEDAIEIPIHEELSRFEWQREFGGPDQSKRMILGAGFLERSYGSNPDFFIPDPLKGPHVEIGYQQDRRDAFLTQNGVDMLSRTEDIPIHQAFGFTIREAYLDQSGKQTLHHSLSLNTKKTLVYGRKNLLALGLEGQIRWRNSAQAARQMTAYSHLYQYLSEHQSLVIGTVFQGNQTHDELDIPLTLGEDSGLRGYDAFSLAGSKTLLFNFEHRWTYPWRTKHSTFGQVLFVDAGNAWKRGENIDLSDLKWGYGVGLRWDMPSLFGPRVFRIDFAHGVDGENFSISASAGQIFSFEAINTGFDKDY